MNFIRAEYLSVATLVGTIVGAGIFGLPYVAAKVGLGVVVAYLLILGGVVALMHLIYGEIVLRTRQRHFLVGYAERYLGRGGKRLALAFMIPSLYGVLLAYSVVGGRFLEIFLDGWLGGGAFLFGLIFAALGIAAVLRRIWFIAELELGIVVLLFVTIVGITLSALPALDVVNFDPVSGANLLLPYGVVLFTVAGFEAIPEIREIFEARRGRRRASYIKTILTGTGLPLVLFIVFTAAVLGVTGASTTEEALTGLSRSAAAGGIIKVAAVFGFLAVFSSFLIMADNLKKIFWYDLGVQPTLSWLLVFLGTVFLFFVSGQAFIKTIALVGAVGGGLAGVMTLIIHQRAQRLGNRSPEYRLHLPGWARLVLILMFISGGAYELWLVINGRF